MEWFLRLALLCVGVSVAATSLGSGAWSGAGAREI
jgi:hypothetical protein